MAYQVSGVRRTRGSHHPCQQHKVSATQGTMVFVFFIYAKLSPFPLMKHSYFPHGMLIKQFIFFELFTQTCICLVFSDSKVVLEAC